MNKTRMSVFTIFIQLWWKWKKSRKESKRPKYQKGRNKTLLQTDDMIVYIKNPEESTEKEPPRTNKWVNQHHRIQHKHT